MILFQKYVHMIFIHSLYPTEKKKNYRICIFLKYFYITLCEIFFIIQQWKSKTKKKNFMWNISSLCNNENRELKISYYKSDLTDLQL